MKPENELVKNHIKESEGFSDKLYKCPANKWTIGWGYNIEDNGLPEDICEILLDRMIENTINDLKIALPEYFDLLDEARKFVLIDMCYNMGISTLLMFKNMLRAVADRDWELAADEMKNSNWYKQVGNRAKKLVETMKSGIIS